MRAEGFTRVRPFTVCWWALLVLLAAIFGGCKDKVPYLPKLAEADVVLAFGDSLTYGTGAAEAESYPAVLGELIKRNVVRSGVPGEVTEQALKRLPGALDEYQPKILILCIGGNDLLHKQDEKSIEENIRAMIKLAKERGIAVVLIGVPKPALFSGAPKFYGALAKEFGLPYEGGIVKDVLYSNETKSDPIHPNAKGYRKIAESIAALMRKAGAV